MATPQRTTDQSQWALIWRQFRKRRLAVACAFVILCLISVSVFAPFLANDRPLYYRGSNRFEYREAVRTCREILSRLAEEGTAKQTPKNREDLLKSLALQGRLMEQALTPELGVKMRAFTEEALVAATAADGSIKLRELRKRLQSEFGGREIPLASRSAWPILASLGGVEIGFMAWNVLLITAPLWLLAIRRLVPAEQVTLRHRVVGAVWVLAPLICGLAWWWVIPSRIDRTDYKAGVYAADEHAAAALVVYEGVVWPPVPYGLDEDDISQKEAKPAWFAAADAKSSKPSSPWNAPHWLGTDNLGRDVLCRMIWGGRVSLSVGIVAVSIYVTIGIIIGAIAGYFRGVCDLVISRIIEVVICFPAFFLILTIVAFVGPNVFNIMVVIGLTGWTGIARLIRGEFLRLVDQEFVLAGRALGYSPARLIFKHVLPNAIAPVMVSATFGVAGAILTESSLSFLGMGISVPTPSWGGMLTTGRDAIFRAPWLIWYPGLAIFVTISCYNLVGEALRDASDPRLRGSR